MNKSEFLSALEKKLSCLPEKDKTLSLEYYSELIDDRVEDGMSEEEAISSLGSVDDIAKEIISSISLPKIVMEKVRPKKKLSPLVIVLLVLGSPIWLSLLVAAASVLLSVFTVFWSAVISIYAITVSFGAVGIAGVLTLPLFIVQGKLYQGLAFLAVGLIFAGLTIFMFHASRITTVGIAKLCRIIITKIKHLFIKKENNA